MENFQNLNPLNEDQKKTIPFDDEPINLSSPSSSGSGFAAAGTAGTEKSLRSKSLKPAEKQVSSSGDRITGVKTFFIKLHGGSLEFLDEQISSWLKNNPGVTVKSTNTAVGEVAGKKTEPNIIVTIWY